MTVMAHGQGGAEVRDDGGAPCLTCNHEAPIAAIPATAHTLRGEGFDASEDGTGRGTPLVPVPFDTTQITSATNRSNPQPGDPCHPLAAGAHAPTIAFDSRQDPVSSDQVFGALGSSSPQAQAVAFDTYNQVVTGDTTQTLCSRGDTPGGNAHLVPAVQHATQVRRLTPRECERLQGFPDDYTLIPWRKKPASECPDGPRYKALGNSMAVPVMRWIGRQIEFAHRFF